jgi:hypothetical protein
MALPVFDATKHHIGLGDSTGTKKGFMITAYQEAVQSLPRAQDFGAGSPLVLAPSLSRWNMDNFLGGAYWRDFIQEDPTVFSSSENVVPMLQGKTLRTVPPIWRKAFIAPVSTTGATASPYCFPFGEYIFFWWDTSNEKYNTADFKSQLTYYKLSDASQGVAHTAALTTTCGFGKPELEHGTFDDPILWCPQFRAGQQYFERLKLTSNGATVTAMTAYNAPAGLLPCTGMEPNAPVPVFCFGGRVYTAAYSATDATLPTWTSLDRLPGTWVDSTVFNSIVYILAVNQDWKTVLFTTDGSALTALLEFPYNFDGRCILSYGGRLFVGGVGKDETGTDSYVEFYEITGTSLRLVKSFSQDRNLNPSVQNYQFGTDFSLDLPWTITDFTVYEGLLYLGVMNEKVISYDLTTDSIYGSQSYEFGSASTSQYFDASLPTGAIRVEWTPPTGAADNYSKWDFTDTTNFTTNIQYSLWYQVMYNPQTGSNADKKFYVDVENNRAGSGGGAQLLSAVNPNDQDGIALTGDVSSKCTGVWYRRKIDFPAGWINATNALTKYMIVADYDVDNELVIAYIKDIYIVQTATNAIGKRVWTNRAAAMSDGLGLVLAEDSESPASATNPIFSVTKPHGFIQSFSHRNGLWFFLSDYGTGGYTSQGVYRMARPGDTAPTGTGSTYTAELETAEFQPEPALNKRWSQTVLLTRYGTSGTEDPTIEYSTDGGSAWTTATVTHTITGNLRRTLADLSSASVSKSLKLRFRFPRSSSTNLSKFTEILAFTTTFSFVDTGKRSWVFTILSPERIEQIDQTTLLQDIDLISTTLDGWVSSSTPLFFTDLDGQSYKVQLVSLAKNFPVVTPQVDGGYREATYSVSLVEV